MNSSIQCPARQVAQLNRNGVSGLVSGNPELASHSFKGVLQLVGKLSSSACHGPVEEDTACPKNLDDKRSVSSTQVYFPEGAQQDNYFFVYNNAILFEPGTSGSYTEYDLCFYSAAAIFNMALTYHQRALVTSSLSEKQLSIAARMYDKCVEIVGSIPRAVDADMDTLQLLALNNRAHLYFYTKEYSSAAATLEQVREASKQLLSDGGQSSTRALSQLVPGSTILDEILVNVLVSGPATTAPCA